MADQAIWQTEGANKRQAVQGMFAEIAPTYDLLNSVMSLRLHHRWRAYAVKKLNLKDGDKALDVCCGTGDFMAPLAKAVGEQGVVAGIDFCLPMLQKAVGKPGTARFQRALPESRQDACGPRLGLGDACQLPIQANSFNGVSVGWGIRNVPDIDAAHRELFRVLKPGGRFVSLDMARPRNPLVRIPAEFVTNTFLPWLGAIFGKTKAYTYLPKSTQRFKTRQELASSMKSAGFTDIGFKDLFFGNICVHWGTKP
jgi:demethylmenaquinone methyltransferase/2-methoxy-6-polyprenyl-1,4-benzoquinol methylase